MRTTLLVATALVTCPALRAQSLDDLSFGTDETFDVLTWNIEWFPKHGATAGLVSQIVDELGVDLLALQEITDTDLLQQVVDGLPGYEAFYESSWFAGLAYVYDATAIDVVDTYEIYTTQPYWSAFPRSPVVMELEYDGELVVVINNHFKCCGDGVLDLGDPDDEETRRFTASNLLKQYVDANFPNDRVIVLGDLNDDLTDAPPNNVYQRFLDDPANYAFADLAIASGSVSDWSFPNWPSHLDHILVTNELFDALADPGAVVRTLRIDDYLPGGWPEYDNKISDHRPVAMKLPIGGGCAGVAATEVVRPGVPPNPIALLAGASSAPILGATWDPRIDHTAFQPAALVDLLFVTTLPANLPLPPNGTVLCDLSSGLWVFTGSPGTPFAVPIPSDCALVGETLSSQGASIDVFDVRLTNALDITIGTF